MDFEFPSTIKQGLPVKVSAYYSPGEPSSYYYMGSEPEVEILGVSFFSGHEIKWQISDEDMEQLEIDGFEYLKNSDWR